MAQADENLTLFLKAAIQWVASRPQIPDPVKKILQDKIAVQG